MPPNEHHTTWEEHYPPNPGRDGQQVNAQLAAIAPTLTGTRALISCGRAVTPSVAEHGWTVVGTDVSRTRWPGARPPKRAEWLTDRLRPA